MHMPLWLIVSLCSIAAVAGFIIGWCLAASFIHKKHMKGY